MDNKKKKRTSIKDWTKSQGPKVRNIPAGRKRKSSSIKEIKNSKFNFKNRCRLNAQEEEEL